MATRATNSPLTADGIFQIWEQAYETGDYELPQQALITMRRWLRDNVDKLNGSDKRVLADVEEALAFAVQNDLQMAQAAADAGKRRPH